MATKQLQILGNFNQDAVQFVEQDLTDEQKAQARENIGAAALDDISSGGVTSWNELEDKPTNVSAFNNDVGYLTSVPEEYITETELNSVIESFDTAISDIIGSGVLS